MARLCGTFHFAGPEVFQGGVATDKFDVYSMGIVLWELLNTVATYVFLNFKSKFNSKKRTKKKKELSTKQFQPFFSLLFSLFFAFF